MSDKAQAGAPPAYSQQGAYPPPPPGPAQPMAPGQPYPPGGAYPQGQVAYTGQPGAVVVAQPVMATQVMSFRESPVTMTCPHCQANITTSTSYVTGLLTYAAAGGACLIGCWLGCCLIPFCIDSMKDVVHTCPSCSREVGRFKRIS